jgi:hypothetical protein
MMDWTGSSQKVQSDQHLSAIVIGCMRYQMQYFSIDECTLANQVAPRAAISGRSVSLFALSL